MTRGGYAALLALLAALTMTAQVAAGAPKRATRAAAPREAITKPQLLDDSTVLTPAKDLALRPDGEHKAEALAHFVEGVNFEENGEMESALDAYREVLNVDPGQVELAIRVAALLSHDDDYPGAIDVLKDAVKAKPNAPAPYLELAFIYAKYLKKLPQAVEYADKGISLDPKSIDGYQRLFEIEIAVADEKKALEAL
ncbi:MAG: hypothetical protein JO354_11835, partial [Verrucomicrobia bacterium]|nr:hypothetical protein [Verrucomicrobiota bacterium]